MNKIQDFLYGKVISNDATTLSIARSFGDKITSKIESPDNGKERTLFLVPPDSLLNSPAVDTSDSIRVDYGVVKNDFAGHTSTLGEELRPIKYYTATAAAIEEVDIGDYTDYLVIMFIDANNWNSLIDLSNQLNITVESLVGSSNQLETRVARLEEFHPGDPMPPVVPVIGDITLEWGLAELANGITGDFLGTPDSMEKLAVGAAVDIILPPPTAEQSWLIKVTGAGSIGSIFSNFAQPYELNIADDKESLTNNDSWYRRGEGEVVRHEDYLVVGARGGYMVNIIAAE